MHALTYMRSLTLAVASANVRFLGPGWFEGATPFNILLVLNDVLILLEDFAVTKEADEAEREVSGLIDSVLGVKVGPKYSVDMSQSKRSSSRSESSNSSSVRR